MNHQAKAQFYGWWIVLAGTLIFVVSNGIGFYSHGVLLDPIREQYGWNKGTVSLAVTLYFLTAGVMGLVIGRAVDKYGSKPMLVIGSIVMGLALLLLDRISVIWQFYAVYILMAVGWCGISLMPVNTLIANWFVRKRGQAMSITMTGLSVGGILLVPFSTFLIARWGLAVAFPVLGFLLWIIIIPLAALVIKQRPADIDQFPDGIPFDTEQEKGSSGKLSYASQMREWTRLEAMSTMAFWAVVIAFFLAMTGQVAYLVHQISFLGRTLGRAGAATAVSVTAGASIVGRLLLGSFIDRWDKRGVIIVLFLIQATAVLALAFSEHIVVLYLCTFAFGLTMGSILMMQSLIIGECFGMVSFATVSGVVGFFVSAGAAFGPSMAGFIYDVSQSYRISFTIFAAMSLLAAGVIYFAKTPNK